MHGPHLWQTGTQVIFEMPAITWHCVSVGTYMTI